MKKKFVFRYYGWLASVLFLNSSFAQEAVNTKELPPITITATKANVSEKMQKSFYHYFKDGSDPNWYDLGKKYLVNFFMNSQENRALFTKNGNMVYHLCYGGEKNLPDDVRRLVKSNYFDYNIKTVIKVFQNNKTVWIVNMEDDKSLLIVRVEDGETEMSAKYKKG